MSNQRIDVHHHFIPPVYAQAMKEFGLDLSGWTIPEWTVEENLKLSDQERIGCNILSITAPGPELLPSKEQQARFCREANEYAAQVQAAHPTRYGFFASVPSLVYTEAVRKEIAYALDELQADGIVLFTRYGKDVQYLGHPDFRPVWDLLDERSAVVFVHPTHPMDPSQVNAALPQPMIDLPHETTRAACDLITSGIMRTHRNVKIILSHAGGTLPYIALRPAAMLPYMPMKSASTYRDMSGPEVTQAFIEDAKRFYFDTALSADPLQLRLLSEFAKPGHVLFGSDLPYAPMPAIRHMNSLLDEYEEKNPDSIASLSTKSALELFPRIRRHFSS
ncbi:hypothetical protein NPX13_g5995 [Xylaria arbuscula]|uniref:6-methylsalicylate decarboxylase n=1 Tax=Xylaria arbuscula TaxID=114810 RepID=A0A9W8NDE1_9PEZI|nr:hypothetical protein NPX13_g5995 [Xylaria arbuscula]